ncbi:MAG: class I SAM-dependent methyltransferase, partial [Acidiferrobacterales bacterium]
AYALADFSEPHNAFVEHFGTRFPDYSPRRVLDLGCGPADISIRFARAYPGCEVIGMDGAEAMLALGREAVKAAGMGSRIRLGRVHLPAKFPQREAFDTVISNSLLHHLANPGVLWDAMERASGGKAAGFVMDLMRPDTERAAHELVDQYAGAEPEILKRDFYHSLRAAYRSDEIRAQLEQAGLQDRLQIEIVSDRHVVVWGYL